MRIFLFSILFSLGCSSDMVDVFSPNYGETGCKPAAYIDLNFLKEERAVSSSNSCCSESGLLMCCFGGSYICVDGSTGTGCGCPSN